MTRARDVANIDGLLTTTGDTYYASAAGTPARLGIGSSAQVLTVSGGVPSWATASAGGMTLLDSGALTGSSVTTASLSQSYKDLWIIVRDWYPSTDAVRIRGRVNGISAANSYNQGIAAGTAGGEAFNSDYFGMSIDTDNTVHKNILTISIPDYTNTSTYKYISTTSFAVDATTTANLSKYCGIFAVTAATSAISTFTFYPSAGNFSGGNYYVYGVS